MKNEKNFKILRAVIAALIAAVVASAAVINNFYLAITGVLIGMLFLFLVRKKYGKELVDERVISISGQASRMTYIISTLTLAILGLFLIFSGKGKNDIYTEALGTIFSYAAMFNIAVYAISFKFFNKKYGAN